MRLQINWTVAKVRAKVEHLFALFALCDLFPVGRKPMA